MHVKEPRAVVDAAASDGVPPADELVEEHIAFRPVRDAGKARVLARHAHAGVAHHEHQEPRLALRETEVDNGLDAFLGRQYQNSSARPPVRPPLRPLRPLMPRLEPR
jgi:hypothetical protein